MCRYAGECSEGAPFSSILSSFPPWSPHPGLSMWPLSPEDGWDFLIACWRLGSMRTQTALPDCLGPELELLLILIVKASHKQAKIQEEGRKILHLLQRGVRCTTERGAPGGSSLGTMHYIPSSWFCFLLRSYHSALSYLLCVSYTGWTLSFYSLLHPLEYCLLHSRCLYIFWSECSYWYTFFLPPPRHLSSMWSLMADLNTIWNTYVYIFVYFILLVWAHLLWLYLWQLGLESWDSSPSLSLIWNDDTECDANLAGCSGAHFRWL